MHFAILDSYDTPTFKTAVLRFASNEGQLKRLLLPYKWLTLGFFGCKWRCISLLGPGLSMTSMAKAIKRNKKQPQLFNQSYKV